MTDLITLRTRFRSKIGNPSTTDVLDSELAEHLNSAAGHIATRYRIYIARKLCEFTTEQGTDDYGLPTDLESLIYAWNRTDEKRLEPIGHNQDSRRTALTTEGHPTNYIRYRNFIKLIPIPDGEYVIRLFYKMLPDALSADDDQVIFDDSWDDGLIFLARWYYYDGNGIIGKATYAWNMWTRWIETKPTDIEEELKNFDGRVSVPAAVNDMRLASERQNFDTSD